MHGSENETIENRQSRRIEARSVKMSARQKTWRRIRIALKALILAALIYSGGNIVFYITDGANSAHINEAVRTAYYGVTRVQDDHSVPEKDRDVQNTDEARYAALTALNADAIGWIHIEGIDIDFPVVRGTDNDYYLERNFEKRRSWRGSIFMDFRNNRISDRHIVVYGHNTRDGSMFGNLSHFEDAAYRDLYPVIDFNISGTPTRWEIFSAYVTGDSPLPVTFGTKAQFENYIKAIQDTALYSTDIDVTNEDQLLTLSTCSHRRKNARFVVHAKRIS